MVAIIIGRNMSQWKWSPNEYKIIYGVLMIGKAINKQLLNFGCIFSILRFIAGLHYYYWKKIFRFVNFGA